MPTTKSATIIELVIWTIIATAVIKLFDASDIPHASDIFLAFPVLIVARYYLLNSGQPKVGTMTAIVACFTAIAAALIALAATEPTIGSVLIVYGYLALFGLVAFPWMFHLQQQTALSGAAISAREEPADALRAYRQPPPESHLITISAPRSGMGTSYVLPSLYFGNPPRRNRAE